MGWFRKKQEPTGGGAEDPRDKVGLNPTGNPTKSSARKRGKAQRKADRDLKGTRWERR